MTGCEKYQEMISRLIDGDLSEEENSALVEHLSECGQCAALYEAFKGVSCALGELEEPPEALHENIMAEIRRENIKKKNKKSGSGAAKGFFAAAACFVLIIGAALGFGPAIRQKSAVEMCAEAPEALPEARVFGLEPEEALPQEEGAGNASAAKGRDSEEQSFAAAAECPQPEPTGEDEAQGLSDSDWDKLMTLLGGAPADYPESQPGEPVFSAVHAGTESHITIYYNENTVYFNLSDSGGLYLADCSAQELSELISGF